MKTAFYISLLAAYASALTLSDTAFDDNVDELLLAEDENSSMEDIVLSQAYDDLSEEGGDAPFSLVQTSRMGTAWTDRDAEVKSSWRIARPNCCLFYNQINYGGHPMEICYDESTGEKKDDVVFTIQSMECGSRTYTVLGTTIRF